MAVEVTIPTVFRSMAGGSKHATAEGDTLAEVLADLGRKHPALTAKLLTEEGQLRRFINFYINDVDVRTSGLLESRTADGDSLLILPAVAGG